MLSDLCLVDRLAQRIGRLARRKERPSHEKDDWVTGALHLVEPLALNKKTNEPAPYPAPYDTIKRRAGNQRRC